MSVEDSVNKNIPPDENESGGGNRILTLLLVISAMLAVLYLVLEGSNVPNPEDKIKQSCGTFHFVKSELAAEGLLRVYCLDKSGEKKEVLIESEELK